MQNGDGTFTLTRKTREQFVFNGATGTPPFALVKEIDRNGYTTTLAYDASNRLSTVTDPAGRALTFRYTGSSPLVTSVTDSAGRTVGYTYDGSGNLTGVTDVNSGVTSFTYATTPIPHLLLTMTDPVQSGQQNPAKLVNVYNASGQVTQQTDPMGRVTSFAYQTGTNGASTTTITEPNGSTTVEQFQNLLLTSMTKGYGTPQQATWSYTHDPDSNGITAATDPNGHVTHSTWDTYGNQLSASDGLGRTTTNSYDAYNDLTSTTDPAGVTTYMTYDGNGNLLSTVRPLSILPQASPTPSPAASAPSAVSLSEVTIPTPTGSPTPSTPTYVAAGPDGNVWFTDPGTNSIGKASPSGAVTEYALPSASSNPRGITSGPDGNLWIVEAGANKVARVSTAATPTITEFALGAGSAPQDIVAGPDGNLWFTESGANKVGRVSTGGSLTEYTLASGSAPHDITVGADGDLWFTETGASKIGRMTTGSSPALSEFALASGTAPTSITAGPDGNLWYTEVGATKLGHIRTNGTVLSDYALASGDQPAGIVAGPDGKLWITDAGNNQLISMTMAGTAPITAGYGLPTSGSGLAGIAVGPDDKLWLAEGGKGQLAQAALAAVTTYSYDPNHAGDLTAITDPDGNTWHYTYDATTGNLLSSSDPLGDKRTLGGYDSAGRFTTVTSPNGNVSPTPTGTPVSSTSTIAYNAFGDITKVTDPLLPGQSVAGQTIVAYDANRNRLSVLDQNSHLTQYTYDADNEQTGVTLPAGVTGSLVGSSSAAPGSVSLTGEGTSDWAHWGGGGVAPGFDDKASGGGQISAHTLVGGPSHTNSNYAMSMSWTDGTPTASATNVQTGLYATGQGSSYSISVPADTTSRTLHLYVGLAAAQGQLTASLSDNSAPAYVDTSFDDTGSGTVLKEYTLVYAAASAGQSLTVTFALLADHGSGALSLLAATLVGPAAATATNTPTSAGTATASGHTATATSTATATPGGGTPAFVQVNSAVPQTNQSSVTATYTSSQGAGDTNVVVIGWNDTSATISSVTDSAGNTYQVAAALTRGSSLSQAIYSASDIVAAGAGANTVTVSFNQAVPFADLRIVEYSGLATHPLDTSASAAGSSDTANSGSLTTSASNELLVGAGTTSSAFTGAGTGYTSRVITDPDGDIVEDQVASSSGSYGATGPLTYTSDWVMQVVAFKSASSIPATATDTSTPTPIVPTFVQVNDAVPQTDQSSVAASYSASQSAGDTNVVVIGWGDDTATISSVTDSAGNTYQVAAALTRGSSVSQAVYYASNIVAASAGANTVTVTFNQAVPFADLRIVEYSDLATHPLDTSAAAAGSGDTASSGNLTTAAAGELLVGAGTTTGGFSGAGTGYTSRVITDPDGDIVEDQVAGSAGSYSATGPLGPGGAWVMQLVAFEAATGTPTPTPTNTAAGGGTATATFTNTPTATATPTDTVTNTATATWTATATPTGTIPACMATPTGVHPTFV